MIEVRAGQSINAAIRDNPGQEIQLEAGATFASETVNLNDRGGSIVGGPGTRLGSGNADPAILGTGGKGWTIAQLELLPNTGGHSSVIKVEDSDNMVYDRLTFDGGTIGQRRVILGNGRHVTCKGCVFKNVWRIGDESTAFGATSGSGPYTIIDNEFEVSAINILIGGGDTLRPEDVPADLYFARNRLTKKPEWRNTPSVVIKNHMEFKAAKRIIYEDNYHDTVWGGQGQSGYSLLVQPMNQYGRAPWQTVTELLVRRNVFRNCFRAVQISGHDPFQPSEQATHLRFQDNDFGSVDWVVLISNQVGDLEFLRNIATNANFQAFFNSGATKDPATGAWIPWDVAVERLYWADNTFTKPVFKGDATTAGQPTLDKFVGEFFTTPMPSTQPEPPPPPPPSVGSVTFEGALWSFGPNQETLRDGVRFANGSGTEYLIYENSLYVLGTDNRWYKKLTSSWQLYGTTKPGTEPPPPPPPADTEGPVSTLTVIRSGNSPNYKLSVDVRDPSGVKRVDFYVGADAVGFLTAPDSEGGSVYSIKAFIRAPGVYTVRVLAWDLLGNMTEVSQIITR